jgi:hypothetical protein
MWVVRIDPVYQQELRAYAPDIRQEISSLAKLLHT